MASAPSGARAAADAGPVAPARTVADAAVRHPRVWPPDVTVEQVHDAFRDDHLHAVLVVDGRTLLAVVERGDLLAADAPDTPAVEVGRLVGRTVESGADLETERRALVRAGRRRAAVVTDGRLVGLLCLKRSGLGFCSDDDVRARAADRGCSDGPVPPVGLEPTLKPF